MRPEETLLLAASRVDDSSGFVASALAGPVDWTRVVELALAHHLAPAMSRALDAAPADLVPPDVMDAFREYRARLAAQNGRLTDALLVLLGALEAKDIFAVPFKGPVLGQQLFGAASDRTPGDLDVLVRRADVSRVRQVLFALGYLDVDEKPLAPDLTATQRRLYERYQCEYLFMHPGHETLVEPHWDLCQRTLALDLDYDGMLDRATTGLFAGRPVRQLAPADLLVALCVHGAKHQWERLAWVRDVAGLLARWPDLDLAPVMTQAARDGYLRVVLLGLAVTSRCAGVDLAQGVKEAIARDRMIEPLVDAVVKGLFHPNPEPRNDRLEPFRYRMRERRRDRIRYAVLTWVTPRRRHIEMAAFPPALGWMYYALRLGIDYAAIPLRLAGRRVTGD